LLLGSFINHEYDDLSDNPGAIDTLSVVIVTGPRVSSNADDRTQTGTLGGTAGIGAGTFRSTEWFAAVTLVVVG
jgi:hypothetical protein